MEKVIQTTSEISLEELLKYEKDKTNISFVIINKNKGDITNEKQRYSLSTMIEIKKKILQIVSETKNKYDGPDKEKKIFTYIYTRLAHDIEYDELASETCSLSGYEYDASEWYRIRASNLVGGLINGKSLCSGYSEILRNVLSEVGIDCLYISGGTDGGIQSGTAHAWNQVYLDGKWYNVDLTNDRDKIVEGRECKHFLKSNKEFTRYEKYDVKSAKLENCEESVQNPEELLKECKYIQPVTTKDIAEASISKNIASSEIKKLKEFINKLFRKNDKEK